MSNIIFLFLKIVFKILDFFSSSLAGRMAILLSSYPRKYNIRKRELSAYSTAKESDMAYGNYNIKLYEWGSGSRSLLLVHGWEGNVGHFSELLKHIDLEAWTVTGFDAPAHGKSSGRKADSFEFSYMLEELIQIHSFDAVLAHSFGSVATSFSLGAHPEIVIPTCIMIAPPNTFRDRVEGIRELLGLSQKAANYTLNYYSKRENIPIDEMTVSHFATRSSIKNATIITDINDRVCPFKWSETIHKNWPVSELIPVKGKGHFKILFDKETIHLILDKLNETVSP